MPCPILIFIRKILPPTRTIWAFQGVSHFWNKCSSTVYTKSALNLAGHFFLKMILGKMSEWGDKKISGGKSTMNVAISVFSEEVWDHTPRTFWGTASTSSVYALCPGCMFVVNIDKSDYNTTLINVRTKLSVPYT